MKKLLKNLGLVTLCAMFLVSCETMSGSQKGAAIGTGVGAGAGAAIGALAGDAGIGAGAGAAAGLLLGGLAGSQSDKKAVQNVKVYINNKEIGTFNINDNQGYSQTATIIAENKGVAVISGPLATVVKEKLLTYGLRNSQIVISDKGNYSNVINITF
jgi:hypothetical protein